ncbi:hypothetical protein ACEN2J_14605 [Pseudorhodobacter sp. W20_MBD10_FR17]|uniref:hypothetical protein n=1 Tax=Pseudorhodobacter sp. W20_MBD10_FR17 TaxID=3240266 RepID=UPI003F9D9414
MFIKLRGDKFTALKPVMCRDEFQKPIVSQGGVFTDYQLRVAQVLRDYGMFDRSEVPVGCRVLHDGG